MPALHTPLQLLLENKSDQSVTLYNDLEVDYAFFVGKSDFINSTESYKVEGPIIAGRQKSNMRIHLKTPDQPGKYKLLFSLKNRHLQGNFASPFYTVEVK